jgi:hypothetical protein
MRLLNLFHVRVGGVLVPSPIAHGICNKATLFVGKPATTCVVHARLLPIPRTIPELANVSAGYTAPLRTLLHRAEPQRRAHTVREHCA